MPVKIEMQIENRASPALAKLSPRIRQRIGEQLVDIASYIQQKAIHYAYENEKYSKGGRIASAIQINVNTAQGTAIVRTNERGRKGAHAAPLEYGAKPHQIPNNPIWRGRTHPGMKGKFFMTRAAADARFLAPRKVGQGIRLAIQDSGFKKR